MKVNCQVKGCTKQIAVPERPPAMRAAVYRKAGFVRMMSSNGSISACPECHAKLAALALELVTLLQGREVPLWQLIPEAQRGGLQDEGLRRGQRT